MEAPAHNGQPREPTVAPVGLCQDPVMRLNPGVTLERADQVLRRAENTWSNARSMQNEWEGYTTAVHDTYNMLN